MKVDLKEFFVQLHKKNSKYFLNEYCPIYHLGYFLEEYPNEKLSKLIEKMKHTFFIHRNIWVLQRSFLYLFNDMNFNRSILYDFNENEIINKINKYFLNIIRNIKNISKWVSELNKKMEVILE